MLAYFSIIRVSFFKNIRNIWARTVGRRTKPARLKIIGNGGIFIPLPKKITINKGVRNTPVILPMTERIRLRA